MNKVIIVDIDGTISDNSHRMHLILTSPKKWKEFFDESSNDPPYEDVYWLVNLLFETDNTIIFVTARPENEREKTISWLKKYNLDGKYKKLYMRSEGDFRDDFIVKKELLQKIRSDGYDPFIALEDRNNVVKMWREEGISCFQVRGHE